MNLPSQTLNAYMVTWQVEREFGGMTTVCLQRAAAFARRFGHAYVVTFNPDPTYPQLLQQLRERGKLAQKVRVINLYEHLAQNPLKPQHKLAAAKFTPKHTDFRIEPAPDADQLAPALSELSYAGPDRSTERKRYFRPNGTVFLTDTKFADQGHARRLIEVLDLNGTVSARFASAAALYRYWLTQLVDHNNSLVVIDSKYCAKFLNGWKPVNVPKLFAFHSTHIKAGQNLHTGALADGHAPIIEQRAHWDGFVFLTQAQRQGFVERFGDEAKTFVIPNPVSAGTIDPPVPPRHPNHLIIAGSLTANKNVEAALKVVAELKRRALDVTLNVVGQCPKREELEQLALELHIQDQVIFHGYSDRLPEHFAAASIQLFTSTNEGQALVLIESQQQGCVPVSFDINFGPADSITDGVNGFLVTHGDLAAMADKAEALLRDPELAARMSANAQRFAENYAAKDVVARWQEARNAAVKLRGAGTPQALPGFTAHLAGIDFEQSAVTIRIAHGLTQAAAGEFELVLVGRDSQELIAAVAASVVTESTASFVLGTGILAQGHNADAIGDVSVRFSVGSSTEVKRLQLPEAALVPYVTAYHNLSLKRG